MSSAAIAPDSDQTARARLRDAAMSVYAHHGAKGATVQVIAAEAGVSTGLIRHYFGSKDGLLAACDIHAIGALLDQAHRALADESIPPEFVTGMYHSTRAEVRYLARALVEGSRSAAELYEVGSKLAERFLSERWPDQFPPGSPATRDAAAVMSSMHLGPLVLHVHLSRRIGVDSLDPAHAPRVGAAMTTLYSTLGEFFAAENGKQLADGLSEVSEESRRTSGGLP
ncbi:TetR/AcrR family transcriptional regulator [Brachybacterium sacelli]